MSDFINDELMQQALAEEIAVKLEESAELLTMETLTRVAELLVKIKLRRLGARFLRYTS